MVLRGGRGGEKCGGERGVEGRREVEGERNVVVRGE